MKTRRRRHRGWGLLARRRRCPPGLATETLCHHDRMAWQDTATRVETMRTGGTAAYTQYFREALQPHKKST